MEVDPSLVEVRRGVEGDAALGDRTVEVLDRAEVLVGERLVEHRPEAFGRLQLGAVGRQVDEPDALGDGQPWLRVPAGVVEDEDDDPVATGSSSSRAKRARSASKNGFDTPFAKYQNTSPEVGCTKAIT